MLLTVELSSKGYKQDKIELLVREVPFDKLTEPIASCRPTGGQPETDPDPTVLGEGVTDGSHAGASSGSSAVEVGAGFDVHGQVVRTGVPECTDVAIRLHNHQMHVQRLGGRLFDGFDHRKSKRQVGHKNPVHDVHVVPRGCALVHAANVSF